MAPKQIVGERINIAQHRHPIAIEFGVEETAISHLGVDAIEIGVIRSRHQSRKTDNFLKMLDGKSSLGTEGLEPSAGRTVSMNALGKSTLIEVLERFASLAFAPANVMRKGIDSAALTSGLALR